MPWPTQRCWTESARPSRKHASSKPLLLLETLWALLEVVNGTGNGMDRMFNHVSSISPSRLRRFYWPVFIIKCKSIRRKRKSGLVSLKCSIQCSYCEKLKVSKKQPRFCITFLKIPSIQLSQYVLTYWELDEAAMVYLSYCILLSGMSKEYKVLLIS